MKLITTLLLLLAISTAYAQDYRPLGSDIIPPAADGKFGHDVAVSADGRTIVVTSVFEVGSRGAVRVYRRSGGQYQQIRDKVAGLNSGDLYGRSVALTPDGTRFVIGTSRRLTVGGTQTGFALLVYDINADGTLTEDAVIRPPFANVFPGHDVAISDDGRRIVAGAPDNGQSGEVYIFDRAADGTWGNSSILTELTPDKFGWTVELNGDGTVLAVGCEDESGDSNDSDVYLYRFDAARNRFQREVTFARTNARNFGIDLDLDASGDHLVIGDNRRPMGANTEGAVDGYRYDGRQWSVWFAELTAPETEATAANFGNPVKISGDASTIVVGDPNYTLPNRTNGRVYVYKVTPEGELTLQTPELLGERRLTGLGNAVAVSAEGNVIVAGQSLARGNDGRVSVYEEVANPISGVGALDVPGLALIVRADALVVDFGQDFGTAPVESRVYDAAGRLLHTRTDVGGRGYTWPVRLRAGAYALQLISGGRQVGRAFVR